jgi:hypothetical protein
MFAVLILPMYNRYIYTYFNKGTSHDQIHFLCYSGLLPVARLYSVLPHNVRGGPAPLRVPTLPDAKRRRECMVTMRQLPRCGPVARFYLYLTLGTAGETLFFL